jgi:hypothetical protein
MNGAGCCVRRGAILMTNAGERALVCGPLCANSFGYLGSTKGRRWVEGKEYTMAAFSIRSGTCAWCGMALRGADPEGGGNA